METARFEEFLTAIERGHFPSIIGSKFTKEQYDQIYDVLKRHRTQVTNWIESELNTRVQKKEDCRTD